MKDANIHGNNRGRITSDLMRKSGVALSLIVLVFACCLQAACSGGGSSANGSSTDSSSSSSTESVDTSPMSTDEITLLYGGDGSFIGRTITITGKVFTSPSTSNGTMQFQIYEDAANSENNTVIIYDGTDLQAKSGDYVKITGTVGEFYTGENMLGGKVTAPTIEATSVTESSYQEAAAPTLKEVDCALALDQNGYTVTVDKVEFAESETRVYVTVNNGGAANFNLYSFNAKAIQGGQQFNEEDNYQANYPKIQTDLIPGVSTSGVLCFKGLQQASFQIQMEAHSDDYHEKFDNYVFDVTV